MQLLPSGVSPSSKECIDFTEGNFILDKSIQMDLIYHSLDCPLGYMS